MGVRDSGLKIVGAKVASLLCYLDPTNAPHGRTTLDTIAKQAGCTRALLSKRLLELRDQVGIHISMGKGARTRDRYRKAQEFAVAAGCHSSNTRKDKNEERRAKLSNRKEAELAELSAVGE